MDTLDKEITNLINLRTNLVTIIIVLTGGIIGLALSDVQSLYLFLLIVPGVYFDALFIMNVISVNKLINKKIGGSK